MAYGKSANIDVPTRLQRTAKKIKVNTWCEMKNKCMNKVSVHRPKLKVRLLPHRKSRRPSWSCGLSFSHSNVSLCEAVIFNCMMAVMVLENSIKYVSGN